jgi:hypothetical protein
LTYIKPSPFDSHPINFPSWPHINPTSPYINNGVTPTYRKEFKPKKAGTKTAHVIFVLDDSSSMQSCRKATIDGFNEFLDGQKGSDIKTYASLYKFDGSSVNSVFEHMNVEEVEPLNDHLYNPRGSTNLLDAIGLVMQKENDRLSNFKKKDRDSVNIVILTDGQENSSRSYNNQIIKAMVEAAEGKEWSFQFLGANINAFAVGNSIGFGSHNTMQYSTNNMESTMKAASRMSADMRNMKASGMTTSMAYADATFTDKEREDAS